MEQRGAYKLRGEGLVLISYHSYTMKELSALTVISVKEAILFLFHHICILGEFEQPKPSDKANIMKLLSISFHSPCSSGNSGRVATHAKWPEPTCCL